MKDGKIFKKTYLWTRNFELGKLTSTLLQKQTVVAWNIPDHLLLVSASEKITLFLLRSRRQLDWPSFYGKLCQYFLTHFFSRKISRYPFSFLSDCLEIYRSFLRLMKFEFIHLITEKSNVFAGDRRSQYILWKSLNDGNHSGWTNSTAAKGAVKQVACEIESFNPSLWMPLHPSLIRFSTNCVKIIAFCAKLKPQL